MDQVGKYPFRKDDETIVWVEFDQMMDQDRCGFLELPDGSMARRAWDIEEKTVASPAQVACRPQVVSDSLGFIADQLPDMQKHLEKTGCKGIEFREDPDVPRFYQVHCSTQAAKLKYAATRGMSDHNSRNGAGGFITQKELDDARELVSR